MDSTDDADRDEGQDVVMPSSTVYSEAIAAGERRLRTWTLDGTLINGHQFAVLQSVSKEMLIEAEVRGDLFSLWIGGERWYPAVLLEVRLAEIARICASLGDISAVSKLFFFMRPHGGLNGLTIQAALPMVGIDCILQLADAWRQG